MTTASCPLSRLLPRCVPRGTTPPSSPCRAPLQALRILPTSPTNSLQRSARRLPRQDVEISVLSCYQDLSAPDADARRTAVDAVKRTLGYAKMLGAKMVGSETAWGACTDEEKAARCPLMLDSIARITEEAARLNVVFAVESVDVHPLCTPELLHAVLDTAADTQHCKVIFDPVNLFCAKDGQDGAYQAAHWEPLAGGHRRSAWGCACQGLPHRGRRQQDPAAAGRGRYGLFCHSCLLGDPRPRRPAAAR